MLALENNDIWEAFGISGSLDSGGHRLAVRQNQQGKEECDALSHCFVR